MASPAKILIDIGFAHMELHEHYVVCTIHEGVVFDTPQVHKLHEVFAEHYHDRPFGYISNRKNDYTINPTSYAENDNYEVQLVGVATLCYSDETYQNALFAERFLQYPHKAFFKMEDCVNWIEIKLENAGL